jgi:hypothetical protein
VGSGGEEVKVFEEFGSQGSGEFNGFAGAGLGESDFGGVKEIARENGKSGVADMKLRRCAIESVPDDGVAEGGEMNANLVGTAGVELDFEEGS